MIIQIICQELFTSGKMFFIFRNNTHIFETEAKILHLLPIFFYKSTKNEVKIILIAVFSHIIIL